MKNNKIRHRTTENNNSLLIGGPEARRILGIGTARFRRLVGEGAIPVALASTRDPLYRRADIDFFLKNENEAITL